MKITIDRVNDPAGDIIFIIRCKDPHNVPFGDEELKILGELDKCQVSIENINSDPRILKDHVKSLIHAAKEKAFTKMQNSLRFAIDNELQIKFHPMCQEIYNWIYDAQKDPIKNWLSEFDPERTK